jgi:formylglycine-generating enzyme required for sulfatase activity
MGLFLIPPQMEAADYTMPTATAAVTNGFVIDITVTYGGSGYTAAPEVSILGGGGSGATARAVITNGSVADVEMISAGAGYTSVPLVAFAPPLPSSLEAIQMVPMLTLVGTVGSANQIQYRPDLGDTNAWTTLTNFVLSKSPTLFVDTSAPPAPKRFYRVVNLPELPPANPYPDWLVWIPPGKFMLGSPASEQDRADNEGPQTEVTLSRGFWMCKHETTQGEYLTIVGSNPAYFGGDTNRPVEQVSWSDATNYCARFNEQERLGGRLPAGHVYRLPTEAEWEYACRGGTTNRFSFGDDPTYSLLGDHAWYAGAGTHPVGSKSPNAWGLYDVHGNVWEWCLDAFAPYPGGSAGDYYHAPIAGSAVIIRGGNWGESGAHCRSAMRGYSDASAKHWGIGFRLVLGPVVP